MAVGTIEYCDKCGGYWDTGRDFYHECNPAQIKRKQRREQWPNMTVEEKCEWLKDEIERVRDEIPFNGPIG